MSKRFDIIQLRRIPLLEGRQQHLLTFQSSIGIVTALHIGTEEAGKIDALSIGSEHRISGIQIHRKHGEAGLSHLTGDRALPDQFIERQIPAIKTCLLRGTETLTGRANRFVSLLGVAGLGTELPGPFAQILLAVTRFHTVAGSTDGLIGEMHRVSTHVGDEAPLIQTLCTAHGFPRREPKLAVRLLLECAGREGRNGTSHRRFFLHGGDAPCR